MSEIDRAVAKTFLQACQNGHLDKVEAFVNQHCIKNWTVYQHKSTGDTALHVAAREGHISIVKYLCENWSEPEYRANVTNLDMKRPLHEAAQFARSYILEYLIQQGVDIDALKRGDWTPLMLACTKKNTEALNCINKLLQNGANLSLQNKDGWTPFLIACRTGDRDIVALLLKHLPQCIDDKSNNGRTALHVAALHACQNVINLLLEVKPELLELQDSAGSTALHESVKSLNFKVTIYLLEQGASIKSIDNIGQNILHVAASVGNTVVIKYILSNKFLDMHAEAKFGITALEIAQKNKQTEAMDILLKYQNKK